MAAKSYMETDRQVRGIIEDVKAGTFKPVYLLMGEEPYYPEKVCAAIIDNCLQEWEKDFNELICYGADVDADAVITAARRFPMMADRQLVVVKEAQAMKSLEDLALYCQKPLDSTVLVILLHGASVDKRKALYKTVLKQGVIVESLPLRDYETEKWVVSFYEEKGLQVDPEGARLLVESAGTDLGKIAVETENLLSETVLAHRPAIVLLIICEECDLAVRSLNLITVLKILNSVKTAILTHHILSLTNI